VRVKGRIASLLEVGTGFNPDLTGRDNTFLNGAILGMTKSEIKRKFDQIVAFAEMEKFIDTPVKRYSTGMLVRLAFAVAAHLEPEILIVDEVLAVGDAAFQKKCLGKMQDVAGHGRTILFVSHNMVAVQTLCQRALMLRQGRLEYDGPTDTAISRYLEHVRQESGPRTWQTPTEAPGNDALRFKRIAVSGDGLTPEAVLAMQEPIRVETEYWILRAGKRLHVTYHLLNEQGITVLATGAPPTVHAEGTYRVAFSLPGGLLNSGAYFLKVLIVENENRVIYQNDEIASFTVTDSAERQHAFLGREPGIIQLALHWQTERLGVN
jgi:lipopolysaccharide transport system ATP-binding protein